MVDNVIKRGSCMKIMDIKENEKELENLTLVDGAIYEAVEEVENGVRLLDAKEALKSLRKKYFEQ